MFKNSPASSTAKRFAEKYVETMRIEKVAMETIMDREEAFDASTIYGLMPPVRTKLNVYAVITELLPKLVEANVLVRFGDRYSVLS